MTNVNNEVIKKKKILYGSAMKIHYEQEMKARMDNLIRNKTPTK